MQDKDKIINLLRQFSDQILALTIENEIESTNKAKIIKMIDKLVNDLYLKIYEINDVKKNFEQNKKTGHCC